MRVLALGAAGGVGEVAAGVLADDDTVAEVVVADRDARGVDALAERLGPKALPRRVDVTDHDDLVSVMGGCDLVVNTVGPFFRFGVSTLAAAIEARCDYVDVCDDPQPTLDMLEMNRPAEAAGITALIGMGATPGIANLLAVRAAAELHTVESVLTCWNIDAAVSDSSAGHHHNAALLHGLRQISGAVPVTRLGRVVQRRALERVRFHYPGLGAGSGRSFGHPEAVTLGRVFPGLRESSNVVVGKSSTLAKLAVLRTALDSHVLSPAWAARLAGWAERGPAGLTLRRGGLPPLFAIATGRRRGDHPATVATALAQVPGLSMAVNTAVPLAVAAPLVAASSRVGVHTPETLIDPATFFADLAAHCVGDPLPAAMTVTTRSWEPRTVAVDAFHASLLTAAVAPASPYSAGIPARRTR